MSKEQGNNPWTSFLLRRILPRFLCADKNTLRDLSTVYQIIPWEYYSPDDYEVVAFNAGKGKVRYTLKAGNTELAQFESNALYQMLIKYKNLVIEQRELAEATVENSTFSAINSVNIEGAMFNAAYGADQTKTGHGIYAEEYKYNTVSFHVMSSLDCLW